MKPRLFFLIIFWTIVLPALADLTSQDLDKIRLIVKEEVKAEMTTVKQELKAEITKTTAEIETLDTRLRTVDQGLHGYEANLIILTNKHHG